MTRLSATIAAAALLAVAGCGGSADSGESAEDFASRVGGGGGSETPQPQGTVAPKVQETQEGAAPGPYTPGTQTDPNSACNAPKVGEYIGKLADEPTRAAVMGAIGGANEVRFVAPGGDFINPDPASKRLNVMLDQQGIIRDARCG